MHMTYYDYSCILQTERYRVRSVQYNRTDVHHHDIPVRFADGSVSDPAPGRCFLVRGAVVPAADTIVLTMGLTANADSIISCNATGSDISFSAFGSEIT